MTTAHRPTYHPAVGSAAQGGYRESGGVWGDRDMPGETTMKYREAEPVLELGSFDDSDDSVEEASESSGSDDSEEMLRRELDKIRREKEMKRKQDAVSANSGPVLTRQGTPHKRKWNQDVVFHNTATASPTKRRFLNDTTRNDFHRRFLHRYIH